MVMVVLVVLVALVVIIVVVLFRLGIYATSSIINCIPTVVCSPAWHSRRCEANSGAGDFVVRALIQSPLGHFQCVLSNACQVKCSCIAAAAGQVPCIQLLG